MSAHTSSFKVLSKEEARQALEKLVKDFDDNYDIYRRPDFDEYKTRGTFIDPFFELLGWDVDNRNHVLESYREVIPEDRQQVEGQKKRPDYGFQLAGGRKLFFVEAKKPFVQLKKEKAAALQLRRYGKSAELAVSVATNFAELAVYDCTIKIRESDSATTACIKHLTYLQYLEEFDFLWDTFSRHGVLHGSFDKFLKTDTLKKGSIPIGPEFLKSLDEWRKYLATSIAKNNHRLSDDEVNYSVQQVLDRLIFLRFCEDRKVEHYGKLKEAAKHGDCYQNLFKIFREADDKYNSGLFDFKKDTITPHLKVDNKVIKEIVEDLYWPNCDYMFDVMKVEVMGQAYEQFLGKVIRITPGHIVKIEEKPEVRKAGGVYYTPEYIVDYIVKNTVGKLIEGKNPKQIEKIKIVDPACGSGSFLIGAFQYLLNYHLDWYVKQGYQNKKAKENPLTPDGKLTTAEKKKILLNNIYGVDIDAQAVEVTKLSLLLKSMEGETAASIKLQLSLWHDRVLPNLDDNIKCGNSLIGTDFYDGQIDFESSQSKRHSERSEESPPSNDKIKPFDWQKKFPEVFRQGGFDAVIGNPPYVFGRDWKGLGIGDDIKSYLGNHYKSSPYQLDFFSIFMEKGTELAKEEDGWASFIVPNVWLTNTYSSSTRNFILKNSAELKIAVPESKVFEGLTVDTVIFFLRKGNRRKRFFLVTRIGADAEKLISELEFKEYDNGEKPISTSLSKSGNVLLEKIKKNKIELELLADITRGVHSYRLDGYGESAFGNGYQTKRDVEERPYHSDKPRHGFRQMGMCT